jgi:hypothetical protein
MHHSYIRWFEIAPLLVFVGARLVVFALIVLLGFTLLQIAVQSASRIKLGALALFFLFEIILLSYVYSRANTPNWFEPFFLFNGYAIPLQALVVIRLQFGRSWRSSWATLGALIALVVPVICVLSVRSLSA